jgi:hypothetical protein
MNLGLPTLTELIALERGFFRAITDCQPRPWGEITRNDQNPDSNDSNHAYISNPLTVGQFSQVLDEVRAFYRHAPASPHVRYYTAHAPVNLLETAAEKGWQTRVEESTWRAWLASSVPGVAPHLSELTIHHPITKAEIEACHLVRGEADPVSNSRHRQTWEHLIRSPNVTPLLARLDGEPAAVLVVVWLDGWGDVDAVETRQQFRRRGVCTALLRFAQRLAVGRKCDGLTLYDIEEGPDRVYARAGFELIGKTQCAMAWRE